VRPTERDGTFYGQAVNAASRVMSEAAGGQILVTAAVHDAVEAAGFSFVDRELYWLRGFPDRWRLYEAEWGRDDAGGAIGPGQTPFVGRERERADLRRAVEDARVGRGSLVLVTGEAGVGKTRLVQEIDAEADARGLRVLVGHSTRDEGRPPYLPFIEMIEQGMVTPRSRPLAVPQAARPRRPGRPGGGRRPRRRGGRSVPRPRPPRAVSSVTVLSADRAP